MKRIGTILTMLLCAINLNAGDGVQHLSYVAKIVFDAPANDTGLQAAVQAALTAGLKADAGLPNLLSVTVAVDETGINATYVAEIVFDVPPTLIVRGSEIQRDVVAGITANPQLPEIVSVTVTMIPNGT